MVTAACVVLLPVLFGAWSVVGALTTSGNAPFSAKWADWLRGHHATALAVEIENLYYTHQQPSKGGTLAGLNPVATGSGASATTKLFATAFPRPRPPADVAPLANRPVIGEGVWQAVGPTVDGRPAMYLAQFRPNTVYPRELANAVWMDPAVLRMRLHPGNREPGGSWPHNPSVITGPDRATVVAVFNAGFRLRDAHGGFYLDGRTSNPLVAGAASVVIDRNGRVDIGSWGAGPTMQLGKNTEAVMQNLTLLVDNGKVVPQVEANKNGFWGSSVKASIILARSGIGITADGGVIYVAGQGLSARDLGESLQRAGAVRAMALDQNPAWVTFNFLNHPNPSQPTQITGQKLYPKMQHSTKRYLAPDDRDFFTMSVDS